jgi:hypothetical protein
MIPLKIIVIRWTRILLKLTAVQLLLLNPSFHCSLQESHVLTVYINCIKGITVSHFHTLICTTRRNITRRFVRD